MNHLKKWYQRSIRRIGTRLQSQWSNRGFVSLRMLRLDDPRLKRKSFCFISWDLQHPDVLLELYEMSVVNTYMFRFLVPATDLQKIYHFGIDLFFKTYSQFLYYLIIFRSWNWWKLLSWNRVLGPNFQIGRLGIPLFPKLIYSFHP